MKDLESLAKEGLDFKLWVREIAEDDSYVVGVRDNTDTKLIDLIVFDVSNGVVTSIEVLSIECVRVPGVVDRGRSLHVFVAEADGKLEVLDQADFDPGAKTWTLIQFIRMQERKATTELLFGTDLKLNMLSLTKFETALEGKPTGSSYLDDVLKEHRRVRGFDATRDLAGQLSTLPGGLSKGLAAILNAAVRQDQTLKPLLGPGVPVSVDGRLAAMALAPDFEILVATAQDQQTTQQAPIDPSSYSILAEYGRKSRRRAERLRLEVSQDAGGRWLLTGMRRDQFEVAKKK